MMLPPRRRLIPRRPLRTGLLGLLGLLGACGATQAPDNRAAPVPASGYAGSPPAECRLTPDTAGVARARDVARAQRDTVHIVLPEPVDPSRAPAPANPSERFAFTQLYETLIRTDCAGGLHPALAAAWKPETAGAVWTFTLRADARFWDGTPVVARDVIAEWTERGLIGPSAGTRVLDASALDDRTIRVLLAEPSAAPPPILASPGFAIARGGGGGGDGGGSNENGRGGDGARAGSGDGVWAQGTGSRRPVLHVGARLIVADTGAAPLEPALAFHAAESGDLRDALDRGADVVVTADPAVVAYAATRPELIVRPLPWAYTYVLVVPHRDAADSTRAALVARWAAPQARAALARDAVSADARGAEPPFAWMAGRCAKAPADRTTPATPAPATASIARRGVAGRVRLESDRAIVYPSDDRTAAELAARLVALGALGRRTVATPLPDSALAAAMHHSADTGAGADLPAVAAYVMPVPREAPAACRTAAAWPSGAAVIALIDTRAHLIVRRGAAALTLDGDGAPHFLSIRAGTEQAP